MLLFGTEQALLTNAPHFLIHTLLRRVDEERYDDRDYIRANLFDDYSRLIGFVGKHLADPFYLEGTQRISIRGVIFREVIVKSLAHREYSSNFTARMVIYQDRVVFENPNRAFYQVPLHPVTFTPRTKNPTIANVLKETGFMDQLGSGVRKVTQYIGAFSNGKQAQFIEGDIFRTIIPLAERIYLDGTDQRSNRMNHGYGPALPQGAIHETGNRNDTVNDTIDGPLNETVRKRLVEELRFIARYEGVTMNTLKDVFRISRITVVRDLNLLRQAGLVVFESAPKSGRYVLTPAACQRLNP